MTRYHITRKEKNGDLYGHDEKYCDPSGCAGSELYLGQDPSGEISKGDVVEDSDGELVECEKEDEVELDGTEEELVVRGLHAGNYDQAYHGGDWDEQIDRHKEMTMENEYKVIGWREIYSKDEFHVYGSLDVELPNGDDAVIACCVGVPQYQESLAKITGNPEPLLDAWYNDSSDWESAGEEHRDGLLGAVWAERLSLFNSQQTKREEELLVKGLHAGNYDQAYLGGVWNEQIGRHEERNDSAFVGGYKIGFISGITDSWRTNKHYCEAWDEWGKKLQSLGCVADNPYEDEEDEE